MKKRIGTILVFMLLIASSSIIVFPVEALKVGGNTLYVDDDNNSGPWDGSIEHPYQHIQQAIDNASSGDTIFIFNGIYDQIANLGFLESSVALINKPLNIIGEDKNHTIIDGKANSIFQLKATPVTIRNVTICNGTSSNTFNGNGIVNYVNIYIHSDFDNIIIDNCIFKDNNEGIHIQYGQNNVSNVSITNCQFINHRQHSIIFMGNNESYNLENLLIFNCTIKQSHDTGISIDSSFHSSKEIPPKIITRNILITDCLLTETTFGLILSSAVVISTGQLTPHYSFNERSEWETSISDSTNNNYIIDKQYSSKIPLFHNLQTQSASIMSFPSMEHVIIEKNIIVNNLVIGMILGGFFSDCILRNNIISDTYEDSIGYGINIDLESEGVIITNNHISNAVGICVIKGKENEISYNNFINNSYPYNYQKTSAPGYIFSDFPDVSMNKWFQNYYDDYKGFGPKIIPGKIDKIGSWLINFYIPWCNVDWYPVIEPYYIE